ncbi:MAG: polymorphic toxin-type HINT domain-containing protein [Halothiobacillus sp.]|jgi:hypothetical protein|nr:polymorphic toxin-type HINT domain-containing protein [Halothiobacillus sp.]
MADSGFAAGTLVHTKEGLKPIEHIQVGDWVLSKPENGGEQAYKRVVTTFAHPPERVVEVRYDLPGQNGARGEPIRMGRLIVTPGHPFWTKEEGWTAASQMQGYGPGAFHFEDKEGEKIDFGDVKNIYVSDRPDVGWMPSRRTVQTDVDGYLWDYVSHQLIANDVSAIDAVIDINYSDNPDTLYFTLPVYNLEVEDFHTYFVGEHGIWVHNQNCGGVSLDVRNIR